VNLIKAGLVQVIWCTAAAVAGSLLLHLVYHVHVQGYAQWKQDVIDATRRTGEVQQ